MSTQLRGTMPDQLLLAPSSKIISCRGGQLSFRENIFKQIINDSSYPDDISVTLLSIVGTPSNEKTILFNSLVEYFDGGRGSGHARGGIGKSLSSANNSAAHDDTQIKPDVNDLADSGIYLLNQPFELEPVTGKPLLIWMLYLYRSEFGTGYDTHQLERLLVLVSSRIAEVTFEWEQVRMLRLWEKMQTSSPVICQTFLYVFPKDNVSRPRKYPNVISGKKAEQNMLAKMKTSTEYHPGSDDHNLKNVGDLNIIEIQRMNSPSLKGVQSTTFLHAISKLGKVSKLKLKTDNNGKPVQLQLSGVRQFLEDCVNSVNQMNTGQGSSSSFLSSHLNEANLSTGNSCSARGRSELSSQVKTRHIHRYLNCPDNKAGIIQQEQKVELGIECTEQGFSDNTNKNQEDAKKKPSSEAKQEVELSRKLIVDMVIFYNDEMKRFLSEGIYDPEVLNNIHHLKLMDSLSCKFTILLELNEKQQQTIRKELQAALDECYPRHCQRNSENWKMKQAKISKCLQKMMSLYMEKIENVLHENPQGLTDQQLETENNQIVEEVRMLLRVEIREKIRPDEPMNGHLASLQAEINEYWECVLERNTKNIEISEVCL